MNNKFYNYDVIVIGGGFSGSEAAMASARSGLKTLIISISMDSVAALQFGNLIRWSEYEDLLNLMAEHGSRTPYVIKENTIFKANGNDGDLRNLKGKIIIDRKRYALNIKELLENNKNLETRQGLVTDVVKTGDGYRVVTSDSLKFSSGSVIACTGTYLNAKIIWGKNEKQGGSPGEICSVRLYENFKQMGLKFRKSSILAAPKILKNSINNRCGAVKVLRINGIEVYAVLPARKPDIDKEIKDIFILPEGLDTEEMYVSGFENNKAEDEQLKQLKMIGGLENVYMVRPGYEIEYACISSSRVKDNLEVMGSKRMFFAGRANGTDSYEDSLAQGFMAGLNAARSLKGEDSVNFKSLLA